VQNTIRTSVTLKGLGLHSGAPVTLTLRPAPRGAGIFFRRTDITGDDQLIPARWDHVVPSRLCTLLRNEAGVTVSTVEHVMAALAGCGIHNALVEVDGPEIPILDGSAAPFVEAILDAGIEPQGGAVRAIRVLKRVTVEGDQGSATLLPADGLTIDFDIDFSDRAIGHQSKTLNMANGAFVRELCDSRTFCRQSDVDQMHAAGLALGGTTRNAVVVDGDRVLSPGGLRHSDEPVRHKMLDALGDLYLAGGPILGRYVGHRAGHAMTNRLLRALFSTPGAYEIVECDVATARRLPGVGVRHSDLAAVA